MSTATRKNWQMFLSLGYVALFTYLFLLRPAPEQNVRAAVVVDAEPARVAALIADGRSRFPSLAASAPLPAQVIQWMAGAYVSPASLLTSQRQVRFWVEPKGENALLCAEMRWKARGGLLGKAVNALLASGSIEAELAQSLLRLKNTAEECRQRSAALRPYPASN